MAEIDEGKSGLSRRQMIKASAIAGAVAWTAPVIIGSIASPAAAGSAMVQNCISYIAFEMNCGGTLTSVKFGGDGGSGGNQYPTGPFCGSFAAPDCDSLSSCSSPGPDFPTGEGSSTCSSSLSSSVSTGTPGVVTITLPSGCAISNNRVWRHKGNVTCKCDVWTGSQSGNTFTVTLTGTTC